MIGDFINYGIEKGFIQEADRYFIGNQVLDIIGEKELDFHSDNKDVDIIATLNNLLALAIKNNIIEDNSTQRDLLDTKLMGLITPLPSIVVNNFNNKYEENPKDATKYFYDLSKDVYYIRYDRIAKNIEWSAQDLDITINLSKPEKDPKEIAAARNAPKLNYPKCLLCRENEGFSGNEGHPARQNLRLIPMKLNNEDWFLQYSPYSYFNEHCILLKATHEPMKVCKSTFARLLDFVEAMPHYFVGSNADLPIVGGSILSHEHYQGGDTVFPMDRASSFYEFEKDGVQGELLNWGLSVIRLKSNDKNKLVELADKFLTAWRNYSDEENYIGSHSQIDREIVPHNTITPTARKNDTYVLNLVLRNNRTSEECPEGIFHPHKEIHNIKKENIGIIEVLGLAILPPRLLTELEQIEKIVKEDLIVPEELSIHNDWIVYLKEKYNGEEWLDFIHNEVAIIFKEGLAHCGVFKLDDKGKKGFIRFIDSI